MTTGEAGRTGLVLSGGGARAAYQAGVLKAVAELLDERNIRGNPFQVVVGTSAGAINATALASGADDFAEAVKRIVLVWENMRADDVYRTDSLGVARSGARWLSALSLGWMLSKWVRARPRSLLDNSPLEHLLRRMIDPKRILHVLQNKHLHALAVTASSYTSGKHVTYYQSRQEIESWTRTDRLAMCEPINIEHLMASSAIPFVFPARILHINGRFEYFGDGSMRQLSPISPAIHLGANRVLIVGVGRMHDPSLAPGAALPLSYPSLAEIAGHALSSIFLDSLAVDIERLERINKTLELMSAEGRQHPTLRKVDVLVIPPSQRIDAIAARHIGSLPWAIRLLLRGVGPTDAKSSALASYLLFEKGYTRELINLGHADTVARREDMIRFIEGAETS